jgi:hypothetical protein
MQASTFADRSTVLLDRTETLEDFFNFAGKTATSPTSASGGAFADSRPLAQS